MKYKCNLLQNFEGKLSLLGTKATLLQENVIPWGAGSLHPLSGQFGSAHVIILPQATCDWGPCIFLFAMKFHFIQLFQEKPKQENVMRLCTS